jgi:hypothetical protein
MPKRKLPLNRCWNPNCPKDDTRILFAKPDDQRARTRAFHVGEVPDGYAVVTRQISESTKRDRLRELRMQCKARSAP